MKKTKGKRYWVVVMNHRSSSGDIALLTMLTQSTKKKNHTKNGHQILDIVSYKEWDATFPT